MSRGKMSCGEMSWFGKISRGGNGFGAKCLGTNKSVSLCCMCMIFEPFRILELPAACVRILKRSEFRNITEKQNTHDSAPVVLEKTIHNTKERAQTKAIRKSPRPTPNTIGVAIFVIGLTKICL